MNTNNTDRLFQEKLQNLRVTPPPAAWNRIKGHLPPTPTPRFKWWRSGWMLLSLFLLGVHLKGESTTQTSVGTAVDQSLESLQTNKKASADVPYPTAAQVSVKDKQELDLIEAKNQKDKAFLSEKDQSKHGQQEIEKIPEEGDESRQITLPEPHQIATQKPVLLKTPTQKEEEQKRGGVKIIINLNPENTKEPGSAAPENRLLNMEKVLEKVKQLKE